MAWILKLLTLLFIDVILSVDNAILIASQTKSLENKKRRTAEILGGTGAIFFRFIFIIVVMLTLDTLMQIPVIYILGGILLIYLGISLIKKEDKKAKSKKAKSKKEIKENSMWKIVFIIIAGDIMLSFDNAFVLGDIINSFNYDWGLNIALILIALLLSLLIILFFAEQLNKLINKHEWLIFIASWLLVSVGLEMFFKDYLWNMIFLGEKINFDVDNVTNLVFEEWLNPWGLKLMSYSLGIIIVFLRWYFFIYEKKEKVN
ncbi:MAG: hypothetical protein TYPL_0270 [Candidatus Tyloplasma litorale]|nr:MAG: hypothetical protein TYPL_0270 [Mycoplasmatales bacterium]